MEKPVNEYRLATASRKDVELPNPGAETLDLYFNNLEQINQTILTSKQEIELAGIIQQGREAQETLSAGNV